MFRSMHPHLTTASKRNKKRSQKRFVTLNENFRKITFSTFPQEFSTGCGDGLTEGQTALVSCIKIDKKKNFRHKLWKSMWKLLETGKKIHCGKLFSRIFDAL